VSRSRNARIDRPDTAVTIVDTVPIRIRRLRAWRYFSRCSIRRRGTSWRIVTPR